MWDRRARVEKVKDGDTLLLVIDQGFGDTKRLSVRLYEVYAPELREPGGYETRDFVSTWLDEADPDNEDWPYLVTFIRNRASTSEVTTLGRYVGIVSNSEGLALNDAINEFVTEQGFGHGVGA